MMLLEAFLAMVIFSIGVIGLLGMQTAAIKTTGDARQRAVAAFYANQIISHMWADSRSSLADYEHNATGDACGSFSGSASSHDNVTSWISGLSGELNGLTSDSVASELQQIKVDTGTNLVEVTVCWKNPDESEYHSFFVSSQVQG